MTVETRAAQPDRTIDLRTWEEFEERLQELRKEFGRPTTGLLFRGQEDSSWALSPTIERPPVERDISFQEYYESIYRAKPEIEAHTGKSWRLPDPLEVGNLTKRVEPFAGSSAEQDITWGQVFSYMGYLRHHGYPSPSLIGPLSIHRGLLCLPETANGRG